MCCIQVETSPSSQPGQLIPPLPHAAYSCIVQVVQPTPSPPVESRSAGLTAAVCSRGWITCECGPAAGVDNSKEGRGADKLLRNSLTAKPWQTLITDGQRKCPWKVVYRYRKTTRTFHVTDNRVLSHVGHAFRQPTLDGTVLHVAKDVTTAMHAKLQAWLRMRITGPHIRQVRTYHTSVTHL